MKVKVIQPHINESGPVPVGTILDLHEDHAADFINARLAVLHVEEPSVPVVEKPVEQVTTRRRAKETR